MVKNIGIMNIETADKENNAIPTYDAPKNRPIPKRPARPKPIVFLLTKNSSPCIWGIPYCANKKPAIATKPNATATTGESTEVRILPAAIAAIPPTTTPVTVWLTDFLTLSIETFFCFDNASLFLKTRSAPETRAKPTANIAIVTTTGDATITPATNPKKPIDTPRVINEFKILLSAEDAAGFKSLLSPVWAAFAIFIPSCLETAALTLSTNNFFNTKTPTTAINDPIINAGATVIAGIKPPTTNKDTPANIAKEPNIDKAFKAVPKNLLNLEAFSTSSADLSVTLEDNPKES